MQQRVQAWQAALGHHVPITTSSDHRHCHILAISTSLADLAISTSSPSPHHLHPLTVCPYDSGPPSDHHIQGVIVVPHSSRCLHSLVNSFHSRASTSLLDFCLTRVMPQSRKS